MTQPVNEFDTDPFEDAERAVDDQFDPDQPVDLDQVLGDDEVDEELDAGYSPPERPGGLDGFGTTAAEQEQGETLDQRLAQEVPDPNLAADLAPEPDPDENGSSDDGEVGDLRAGRLVAPDEGLEEDREKDLVASDVGIDAGAAGAEEAAVHMVEAAPGNEPDRLDELAAELAEEEAELVAGAAAAGVSPQDLSDLDRDRPANR